MYDHYWLGQLSWRIRLLSLIHGLRDGWFMFNMNYSTGTCDGVLVYDHRQRILIFLANGAVKVYFRFRLCNNYGIRNQDSGFVAPVWNSVTYSTFLMRSSAKIVLNFSSIGQLVMKTRQPLYHNEAVCSFLSIADRRGTIRCGTVPNRAAAESRYPRPTDSFKRLPNRCDICQTVV